MNARTKARAMQKMSLVLRMLRTHELEAFQWLHRLQQVRVFEEAECWVTAMLAEA